MDYPMAGNAITTSEPVYEEYMLPTVEQFDKARREKERGGFRTPETKRTNRMWSARKRRAK